MKNSYMQRKEDVKRNWYVIDAEGQNLGRVATKVAHVLRGKHKPTYTPHIDCGDYVIVVNAAKTSNIGNYELNKVPFTKEMKKNYTILVPQMLPIHFEFVTKAVAADGYNLEYLRECTPNTVETGLKYVNNDACYPSILTTGQFIEALQSGKYDVNKTAIMMSQTGGGCRATNYIGFIRKALKDAGFENVPVISFNIVGMEKNPGFKLTLGMVDRGLKAVILGDLLQKMLTKNRAYEVNKGETKELFDKWMEKGKKLVVNSSNKEFKKAIYDIVDDFEKIELDTTIKKPKVGIVGEVLTKPIKSGKITSAPSFSNKSAT